MKSNSNDDEQHSDHRRRHHSQQQLNPKSKCCFHLFDCLNLHKKNSVDIEQPAITAPHNPAPINLSNSSNSLNSNSSNKAGTSLLRDNKRAGNNSGTANALQLPTPTQQAQLENILDNLYSEKLQPAVENLDLGDDIEMADCDGTVKLSPRSKAFLNYGRIQ